MKRNLLILVIILLIGFIVNSCGDEEKKSSCECNPKQHNEGESCCTGNGCNCIIILNCNCPADTFHLVGENCRGLLNCECELNVVGERVNGIAVTNRSGIDAVAFTTMIENVTRALDNADLSSDARKEFLKGNLIEIKIIPQAGELLVSPVLNNGVLTIENGSGPGMIRNALRDWCEEKGI